MKKLSKIINNILYSKLIFNNKNTFVSNLKELFKDDLDNANIKLVRLDDDTEEYFGIYTTALIDREEYDNIINNNKLVFTNINYTSNDFKYVIVINLDALERSTNLYTKDENDLYHELITNAAVINYLIKYPDKYKNIDDIINNKESKNDASFQFKSKYNELSKLIIKRK